MRLKFTYVQLPHSPMTTTKNPLKMTRNNYYTPKAQTSCLKRPAGHEIHISSPKIKTSQESTNGLLDKSTASENQKNSKTDTPNRKCRNGSSTPSKHRLFIYIHKEHIWKKSCISILLDCFVNPTTFSAK